MNYTKKLKYQIKTNIKSVIYSIIILSFILTGCSDTTGDGEKELQKEEYGFIVLNQNGEVLSDAEVVFNNTTEITGSDGTVKFEKPESEIVSLEVTCMNYYDYSNPSFQVTGNISTITLYARTLESHRLKTAVYKNTDAYLSSDVDLLTEYKKVNISTSKLDFDIETSVLGDEDTVTKYELHQLVDGCDYVIQSSTNGYFKGLTVNDFQVGTSVFVTVYDKNNHQTSTALNFEIGKNPNITEYSEFSFGDEISFVVKDEIPIFGGKIFNLDFPSLPIDYKYSEDKVYIGFNVEKDTFNDEEQMKQYKKIVSEIIRTKNTINDSSSLIQKLKERQQEKGLMRLSGFEKGVDVCIGGYAEAGFDSNGQLSVGEGCIYITIKAEAEWGWQVIVWSVPVVVDIDGSIEANLAASTSYSFSENEFTGNALSLTIKPELKAKAGVGFEYLSAGVYGSAELETKLVIASEEEDVGFQYLDFTSTIGIYSKIAFFESEKNWAKGTFNLWTHNSADKELSVETISEEAISNIEVYSAELYDTSSYYPIMAADNPTIGTVNEENYIVLAGDISSGSTPVTVSDEDTALTLFTAQISLGDAQSTYSKLFYSYYENGCWTNSVMMDEEIKNQMNPQLYCNNGEYYLLYQEADFDNSLLDNYKEKTEEEQKALLRQAFLSYDIHVMKFDKENKSFINLGTIETEYTYDYNADMTFVNDIPYVYSVSNDAGDFFGTDENTTNQLLSSYYNGEQWITSVIQSNLNSVTRLSAGIYEDKLACIYSVDGDNDLLSQDDVSTYIYNGETIKIMDGTVSQIKYGSLPGQEEKVFLIAGKSGLNVLDKDYSLRCVLENSSSYYGQYAISDNAIYDVQQMGVGTEVFAFYLLGDNEYSNAIQVTFEDKWQRNISAMTIEGKDIIVSLSEEYNDESELFTELVLYELDSYYDLSIDSVYINYEDLLNQSEVLIEVTLSNNGNIIIPAELIDVKDSNGNLLPIVEDNYSTELFPGDSYTCKIYVQTNEETAYGTWVIETSISNIEGDVEEHNKNNNCYEYITGYSDFVIETQVNNSGAYPYILIDVTNQGNVCDSAELVLYDANDLSKKLKTYNISSLATGNSKLYKVNLQKEWADDNGKLAILVKVINSESELYLYNNYEYEYATMNYGTYNIFYELNGGINSENNLSEYTTTDNIVFENPTREGYKFGGWYTTASFDVVTQITELKPGSAGDLILYAKWTTGIKGDANGDNEVLLDDVLIALKAALQIIDVDIEIQNNLDIDCDGVIGLNDVLEVLKAALSIIKIE